MRCHFFLHLPFVGLLLLFGFAACKKKDGADIQYPITFEVVDIIKKSSIKECSPEGIKNVTPPYRAVAESIPVFHLENYITKGEPYLTLQSDRTALFHGEHGADFSFRKNGEEWRFVSINDAYFMNLDIDIMTAKMPKDREAFKPMEGPSSYAFTTKQVRLAMGDLTALRIPVVSYYLVRLDRYTMRSAAFFFHNRFDESVLAELLPDDLLFIQEFELVCRVR